MNDDIIKAVCAAVVLGEGENYEPVHLEPREARQAIAAYHAALAARPVQEPVALPSGRTLTGYDLCSARAISDGSTAQMMYFIEDAKKDIAYLTRRAAPQPAHGTSATERATPAPADHLEASGSDHMPRYTTKRLHDEIAKARAYGLEMAAQLIVANIVQDTSSGKVLSPREEGNRDGLHYAAAIRSLASSEGPL